MIENEANASENPESLTGSEALRDHLAEPIGRVVENIVAPIQQMMRTIAEMFRPYWLRAFQQMQEQFQKLVRNPMLDALRRIREQIAAVARPVHSFFRRIVMRSP